MPQKIPQKPRTNRELLLQAVESPPYVSTEPSHTKVFSLPGMDDYILKIYGFSKREFKKQLQESTNLTPLYLCKRNFGQGLLRSDNDPDDGLRFEIVKKIPGTSLETLFREKRKEYLKAQYSRKDAAAHAHGDMLKILDQLPQQSFIRLLQDVNYLTDRGIGCDFHWGNISLSDEKLSLLDTLHKQPSAEYNAFTELKEGLLFGKQLPTLPSEKEKMRMMEKKFPMAAREYESLERKLNEAGKIAHSPITDDDALERWERKKRPFNGITDIRTELGGAVTMEDSPKALLAMLRKVEKYRAPSR